MKDLQQELQQELQLDDNSNMRYNVQASEATQGDSQVSQTAHESAKKRSKVRYAFANYFTAKRISLIAVFAAIAMVLYNWASFSVPIAFPAFLSFDLSNIPVLLSGFMLGPVAGVIVVAVRFLLKMPFSSTMFVGEAADLALGLTFVIISSIIYKYKRNFKWAVVGLSIGAAAMVGMAVLLNRFVLVYFYVELFFGGNFDIILNLVRPLYQNVTRETFFLYYLLLATIPFNLITALVTGGITLGVYKPLSRFANYAFNGTNAKKTSNNNLI